MRLSAAIALLLSVLFLTACSYVDGVSVTLRGDSFSALKTKVVPFLLAKGFRPQARVNDFNASFMLRLFDDSNPPHYVYANFYSDEKTHYFFIGKGNTRRFFADEVRVIDECAKFLAEHSGLIVSGSASTAATSSEARETFYAKIKKG